MKNWADESDELPDLGTLKTSGEPKKTEQSKGSNVKQYVPPHLRNRGSGAGAGGGGGGGGGRQQYRDFGRGKNNKLIY